ncbi:signal peptide peptidase SppA [Dokdonella sp.]|uniref:signal peptide peptidase SppA n=1 Tax=Dokdonella sp. TaxID=2291710 RepID=UPI0025C3D4EC|nr:signal peptide peptidase SppA [Dokdonella sp.]MBX3691058.1 signal peptide peptidase SppA [Dokdonella sp.]MCW5566917.1 signal peptide peptidase SppA [Dokdonella sp.]
MSDKSPGLIGRFFRGLWNTLNFTRRLVFNLIFVVILFAVVVSAMRGSPTIEAKTALVLDPEGTIVEQYSGDPVERALAKVGGEGEKQIQLRDLLRTIDLAAKDARIERIVLLPDQVSAGLATLREIGQALDRFRDAGKELVVVSEGMSQGGYYLAAHANEILLDPQGMVLLEGLSSYRSYYRDALDKLGVDVHLIKVGEYKSAAEPFVLNKASDAAKEATRYWMGGIWESYLDEIAALRKLDPATLRNDIANLDQQVAAYQGDLAKLALERKLVDRIATRAEVRELLKAKGAPSADGETFRQVNWRDYLSMQVALPDSRPQVGVIVAQGDIVQGERPQGTVGGSTIAQLIRQARKDEAIKALVLRVDSPGGDAYASEVIRREIELIQAAGKPVIVSMGDVAASGGYWISMNADEIWAQPNTITGSIGIFGLFVTIPEALGKLGIHTDGVGTAPLAGALDIRRPFDPKAEAIMTSVIEKGYRDFIGKVADARGKSSTDIDTVARGRVWSGEQAKERGLVDKLGGLQQAIVSAAGRAGLGDGYRTQYVEKPLSTWERLALSLGETEAAARIGRWSGFGLPPGLLPKGEIEETVGLLRTLGGGRLGVVAHCFCEPERR